MVNLRYLLLCAVFYSSGCVSHDPKVKELRGAHTDLSDLAGRYAAEASYVSGDNPDRSFVWWGRISFRAEPVRFIDIAVNADRTILITTSDGVMTELKAETDYKLVDGKLIMLAPRYSNRESLGIGIADIHAEWIVLPDGNLAIVERGWMAGLFIIMPVAGSSESVAIFERLSSRPTPHR